MPHSHDDPVIGLGGYFQAVRKSLPAREQGMIAPHFETLRKPCKDPQIPMRHHRWFAMHRIIQHAQFSTERFHDSLQAQTDSEDRNASLGGEFHYVGHAEV